MSSTSPGLDDFIFPIEAIRVQFSAGIGVRGRIPDTGYNTVNTGYGSRDDRDDDEFINHNLTSIQSYRLPNGWSAGIAGRICNLQSAICIAGSQHQHHLGPLAS